MKIWYGSDLHADFWEEGENITDFLTKEYDLYVFAGDLSEWNHRASRDKVLNHLEDKKVVWIPGNHEFYRGEFHTVIFDTLGFDSENRTCLDGTFLDFPEEKLRIFGSTFWTDFNGSTNNMQTAESYMNDYRLIGHVGGEDLIFSAAIALKEHYNARKNLKRAWETMPKDYKMLVVTHHAPSFKSLGKKYTEKRPELNYAYASSLEGWLKEEGILPSAWIHGHIHERVQYEMEIGDHRCLVVSNPFGYPKENLGIKELFEKRFLDVNVTIEAQYED